MKTNDMLDRFKFVDAYLFLVGISAVLALPQLFIGGDQLYWATVFQTEWGKVRMLLAFGYTAGYWFGTRRNETKSIKKEIK